MSDDTHAPLAISLKDAVATIYLAQHEPLVESDFQKFIHELETENIPWDFENKRFLDKVRTLRETLVSRLQLESEKQLQETAEEAITKTLTKDELDSLTKGLEEAQNSTRASKTILYKRTDELVDQYIRQLKDQGRLVSSEQEAGLRREITLQTTTAIERGDLETLEASLSTLLQAPQTLPADTKDILRETSRLSKATEITLVGGDEIQKGSFIQLCLTNPAVPPELLLMKHEGSVVSEKVFALPSDITQALQTELNDPSKRKIAIEEAAKNLGLGVSRPLNDVVTAIGGPGGKELLENVYYSILGKTLDEVAEKGTIGEQKLSSTPDLQEKLVEMEQIITAHEKLQGKTYTKTRDYFRQQAAAAGAPTPEQTMPPSEQPLFQNNEPLSQKDSRPFAPPEPPPPAKPGEPGQSIAPPVIQPSIISVAPAGMSKNDVVLHNAESYFTPSVQRLFHLYLTTPSVSKTSIREEIFHYIFFINPSPNGSVWKTLLGNATRTTTTQITKKATSVAINKATKKAAGAAAGKAAAAVFGASLGGPVGAFVTFVATSFIGKGLSVLWVGVKGLFSALKFGDVAKGISSAFALPTKTKPWYKEDSWIIALSAIMVIVLLMGVTQYKETVNTSAIVAEKTEADNKAGVVEGENTGRGNPHGESDPDWGSALSGATTKPEGPLVDYCATNPSAPACQKISGDPTNPWPVISSTATQPYVTQGPGGTWSHAGSAANAVDIGTPIQSAVISPVSGTVTKVVNSYADNSGFGGSSAGGGYGNYIEIKTTTGNTLIMGHLAYNSMPSVGASVTTGIQVGRVGNTGNSTGPHLHMGYTNSGAPSINTLLPVAAPVGCTSARSCGYLKAAKK